MKCLILFSGKNKKNINLSSAENAQRLVKAKHDYWHYRICPKILNTKVSNKMPYANSADQDQTAPEIAV